MIMENTQFEACYKWVRRCISPLTLEMLLKAGTVEVTPVKDLEDHVTSPYLMEWYAVSNTEGIIAYFGEEKEAQKFRLGYINRLLNT